MCSGIIDVINDDTVSLHSPSLFSDIENFSFSDKDGNSDHSSVESVELSGNKSNIYDHYDSQLWSNSEYMIENTQISLSDAETQPPY